MKILNKFIWSKKEPSNKNDIWFDGSTWRMYTEEAWQSFTLPVDAADKVAKVIENASEVYQEKLNAGYGIIIEGDTISVDESILYDDSDVWEAIETLQQNKVEQIQLNDYVPLDRYSSTSQVLMDNISELASIKLDKADVATINGQSLIEGGNIVIEGGDSSHNIGSIDLFEQIIAQKQNHNLTPEDKEAILNGKVITTSVGEAVVPTISINSIEGLGHMLMFHFNERLYSMCVMWNDDRCYINGFFSFSVDSKLYADSELSEISENSVQNKVVTEKLAELSAETKKLYFTEGTVIDNSENDSDILSRSSFIPVNLGDVITSSIFRIKKYDAFRIYISDDLTSIQTPSLSEIVDYTITDEKCKFIRIVVGRGKESVILKNGLPYLPYKEIEADFGGSNSKVYPFKPITLEQYEANNLLGKNALNNRSAINGAILGLWVKNPEENTTYHLTQFRYRQVSSDWGSTEYSAIRIARKSASTETDIILEDRKSQTITEEIQIFNTEKYLVIVDWSKTTKGFGYAEGATAYNEMSDVILQRNNTEYLTMLGFNFGESTEEKPLKIVANGQQFESVDGVIELPMAGTSSLGLMSSADKRKLDGLQQGNIEIHGSGIAKNASAFGFLPTNDGTTNANNLQSCVNGGGTIIVDLVGTYSIAKSIMLDSDTKLIFGKGVKVSLVEENGSSPKYPFINRGALTEEYNENIAIEGLHIVTNGIQGNDITSLPGQRGYIAMKRIKNLTLKDIEILDVPSGWYTIHIQQFYNINLEHIHIEGMKDGIHLGVGKKFRIAHCLFKTNDDSIALNAHDYPSGTSEFGWIEDGIIEDITILPTPSGNMSRGVYALGGAWADWKNGNSYQPLGDACVSNNGVYVTMGARSTQKIVSTQQPNHASGKLTYSDGLTWIRLDNQSAQYDAGVRNISVRDLHIASDGRVATFNLDNDDFSNSLYEGCAAPVFENITFENIRQDDYARESAFYTCVPFSNLRLSNFDLKVGLRGISTEKIERDTYSGRCTLLITGMALYQKSIVFIKNDRGQRHLDVKMTGTMIIQNSTSLPTIYGSSTVNIVSDIELGKNL